ncbi:MAG: hypothetical protein QOD03_447 [Verrucomicrobiota bacterium]
MAIALFSMVVAAIYSSWIAIMRGAKSGLDAAAAVQRSRVAISTIEQALSSVRSFATDIQYYSFLAENGSKPTLSFVTRLSQSFPRSGKFGDFDMRRVTFSLESGDGGSQLVMRQNPILMELDRDENEHPVVLAKEVQEFKMDFWDTKAAEWTDEWTETNQLPKMVKITLQTGPKTFESRPRREVVRIVALPSVTVQPNWQSATRAATAGGSPNPNLRLPK